MLHCIAVADAIACYDNAVIFFFEGQCKQLNEISTVAALFAFHKCIFYSLSFLFDHPIDSLYISAQ